MKRQGARQLTTKASSKLERDWRGGSDDATEEVNFGTHPPAWESQVPVSWLGQVLFCPLSRGRNTSARNRLL